MQTALHCRVSHTDGRTFERVFQQDVVKIGRLPSSDLHLDGAARMHAVIECEHGREWRLIELGSSVGTRIGGEYVDKSTPLGESGEIGVADWTIAYEVREAEAASFRDLEERIHERNMRKEMGRWDVDHHRAMLDGLADALGLENNTRQLLDNSWKSLDDAAKRDRLRMLVARLRQSRVESRRYEHARIASMLQLGAEGLEAIYDLTPDEALARGVEALGDIAAAKQALGLLQSMDMPATVRLNAAGQADAAMVTSLQEGHERLVKRLEVMTAAGTSVLLACVTRAGGYELTDAEREALRDAFKKMGAAVSLVRDEAPKGPTLV